MKIVYKHQKLWAVVRASGGIILRRPIERVHAAGFCTPAVQGVVHGA